MSDTNTQKGRSVQWAKIKANCYALFHGQCVYTETKRNSGEVHHHITLVATCTGSLVSDDFEIKKVFYERVKS